MTVRTAPWRSSIGSSTCRDQGNSCGPSSRWCCCTCQTQVTNKARSAVAMQPARKQICPWLGLRWCNRLLQTWGFSKWSQEHNFRSSSSWLLSNLTPILWSKWRHNCSIILNKVVRTLWSIMAFLRGTSSRDSRFSLLFWKMGADLHFGELAHSRSDIKMKTKIVTQR